jgi:hypothetical protein
MRQVLRKVEARNEGEEKNVMTTVSRLSNFLQLHVFGAPIDFTLASPHHVLIMSPSHETCKLEL